MSGPRPWAEATPSELDGVEVVAFDIDDTVTRNGRLEADAFSSMHALAESGYTLIAVTGRPLGWADVLAGLWPVRAVIGENGAGWSWRVGRRVRTAYASPPDVRATHATVLSRVREAVTRELPDVRVAGDQPHRRADLAFDIGEAESVPTAVRDRLAAIIRAAGAHVTRSSVHMHAVPGDWTKATGLEAVGQALLDRSPAGERAGWIFIGDSGNDASAFEWIPLSVGVANVREHLEDIPTPPRWITAGDRGRGFTEVAARLLGA